MTPTRRAAGILVLVALAAVVLPVSPTVALLAASCLVGVCAVDAWLVRRQRPSARVSEMGTVARSATVPLRVEVDIGTVAWCRVLQPAPPELEVVPAEATGTVLDADVVGRHRGVHTLGPAVVRFAGPLGLVKADRRVGSDTAVTVLPDLPTARRLAAARRRGRSDEEGRLSNRLGLGTEFESIRDYSPDDDVRQINWVASSRAGRPLSNQYRVDENRDLVCLVDHGRLMAGPLPQGTRLDVALDALAALVVAAEDAGDRVGTVAFAGSVTRVLAPRRRNAENVVRSLFDLEPHDTEAAYDEAFQTVAGRKRALVCLFSDLMDEAAARSLTDALAVLTRRHAVLVATASDPQLVAASLPRGDHPFDVVRSSVAVDLLAGRKRALAALAARGAVVVEADGDRLGPACVSAYLRLKQRARL